MGRTPTLLGFVAVLAACSSRAGSAARGDGTPRADTRETGRPDGDEGSAAQPTDTATEPSAVEVPLPADALPDGDIPPPAEAPPTDRAFAVELASGNFHTCARMSDRTVRCWGMGEDGQLGDGASTNRSAPVKVAGIDHAVQIVADGSRTCAVRVDGSVWCWGSRATVDVVEAQLAADASVPPDLSRPLPEREGVWETVRRLALGMGNDCAVAVDGRVLCRGSNTRGGIGDGTTERRVEPVVAPGIAAVDVAVGMNSTCVRTAEGRVWCWGWNDYCGQLGDGTRQDHLSPTEVPGLAGVIDLAMGENHACAVVDDGSLSCWGCNEAGELGDGTVEARATPTKIAGLAGVRTVDARGYQTCVTLADGTVRCWGSDTPDHAQLWTACPAPGSHRMEGPTGNGGWRIGPEEHYCPSPAPVPGLVGVLQAVPAVLHACVLLRDGSVRCWGTNYYGAVGDGTGGDIGRDRETPTPVVL
jgi:alpha-tubulin suppressor-like RCC1 family protein